MDSIQNIYRHDYTNSNNSEISKEEESNKKSSDYERDMNGESKHKIDVEFNMEQNSMTQKNMMNFQKNNKKTKNSNLSEAKDKKFYQFIQGIFNDDKTQLEKILKACQSHAMVNRLSIEGFTPIQYAALFGSISTFEYLLSLKAQTDKEVEGLHLIHLSLSRAVFIKDQDKCLKMFQHIYDTLPEQRNYTDRLGRTFLHLIFEYDFSEALDKINISLEDLFQEDYNGDYVINYTYIYNACQCFWKVAKDPVFLSKIYLKIREKYNSNKGAKYILKEKFLENLFLHQNHYAIAVLVINSNSFAEELMEDLNNLFSYYSNISYSKTEIEQNGINQMKENINYVKNIVRLLNSKEYLSTNKEPPQFNFPIKKQEYTAIVFNSNCIKHIKLPDDPINHLTTRVEMYENSDRLQCLIGKDSDGIILNDQVFHYHGTNNINEVSTKKNMNIKYSGSEFIVFVESNRKSKLNDILKCHDIKYIQKLKSLCEEINNLKNNNHKKNCRISDNFIKEENGINVNLNCINTNPQFQNEIMNNKNQYKILNYRKIDCDTYINEYSYENIYNTTGCVFDAIDLVMKKDVKNAFALIRPPGHHAGFYGPVENPVVTSTGFCIVNNVAIGAAYAKNKYRNEIKKIAIFDFDVHHGNGTEEIIQMLNFKKFSKSFDCNKSISINIEDCKQINWLDFDDAKNMLFISTHIYDKANEKKFYPYSGGTETNTGKNSNLYPGGILNIPFGFRNNLPYEYRNVIRAKVIPRLCKFKPDIIFISAGFDGHENESINQHHMSLNEFDFAFITQQIQFVANKYSQGRVVSVLEGGYNVSTGLISSFAQSTFTHARFMNLSINMIHCFDVKLTGLKRKYEMEDEMNIYNRVNKTKNKPRRSERIRHHEEDYKKDDF